MHLPTTRRRLRRQLTGLVYRDAARAYSAGLALAVFPLVYLFREWPPWVIRDTLVATPPPRRAMLLAIAHMTYGLATTGLVRRLLASERLRWWWALPLPASWWQRIHLRHLVLLDAPWLLAIAYGVSTRHPTMGLASILADGLPFVVATLAGQIALASVAVGPPAVRLATLGVWGAAVAGAVMLPGVVGSAVGVVALVLATRRLDHPLPERRAHTRGRAGGHPILALARLGWLATRRHDAVAIAWGAGLQLLAAVLILLANTHVGPASPRWCARSVVALPSCVRWSGPRCRRVPSVSSMVIARCWTRGGSI
ncbi:MAG: hypothetical protein K0V04_29735 [Deltaproteobacteria bacterium]|nr:hypothetical protein [Deltaproteobacteria bacterium]